MSARRDLWAQQLIATQATLEAATAQVHTMRLALEQEEETDGDDEERPRCPGCRGAPEPAGDGEWVCPCGESFRA